MPKFEDFQKTYVEVFEREFPKIAAAAKTWPMTAKSFLNLDRGAAYGGDIRFMVHLYLALYAPITDRKAAAFKTKGFDYLRAMLKDLSLNQTEDFESLQKALVRFMPKGSMEHEKIEQIIQSIRQAAQRNSEISESLAEDIMFKLRTRRRFDDDVASPPAPA